MRLFFELTKRSFQRQLSYRAAALAGLVTNVFFGLLRIAVLVALFGPRENVAGFSIPGAITYAGLTQGIIAYLSIFGWYEMMSSVDSGEVGADLLKPMNFFTYWLARGLGQALSNLLSRTMVTMVVYALIFDLVWPSSLLHWFAFGVSLIFSWLATFSWHFIVNLFAFWSPNARGSARFTYGFLWIFSGFLMPLRFYPDWFIQIARLTPFPIMVNTSVEIYLGILSGPDLVYALAEQLLWIGILIMVGQGILQLGIRRLVIQGG